MTEDFDNIFGERYVKVAEGVYIVQFEAPGFNRNNLTVEIDNGFATIKGERELNQENHSGQSRISKRFTVGEPKDVKATVKDGIFTLTLKYSETKSKKVKIDFEEDSPKETSKSD